MHHRSYTTQFQSGRHGEPTAQAGAAPRRMFARTILSVVALLAAGLPSAASAQVESLPKVEPLPALDEVLKIEDTPIVVEADPAPTYSWYQPAYYLSPEIWDGSIQMGINGATGNAESFNISAGYDLKRETKRWILSSDLKYFNASQQSVLTQNFAIFNAGIEWKSLGPWTAFVRNQLQYNEFQPYDLRLILNGGLGYSVLDDEVSKLKVRIGAGATRDFGGPDEAWKPEALFGMDSTQKLNDRQKIVGKIDYFPSWDDFSDYRLVSDASWQIVLDESTNLSLKLGVVTNYDSTPPAGSVAADVNYVALLMWKL